jgi:hypothetical protein
LATGLKKLPSEIRTMTLSQARRIFRYWESSPPEHEMLALLAGAYTTWKPANARGMTPEQHRASLEARWKAGAMNVRQLFEATGGGLRLSPDAPVINGMGGIGPFPGTLH